MRVLLMWPWPDERTKVVIDAIEAVGHEIVYWIGEHPVAHLNPASSIFHDHYDAWDGKPAEALAKEKYPPPSAALISSMYETESIIMTMMNKHYDKAPVDERKQIYYDMLGYWSMVLDKMKPEAIVFNDVPHSIYSNILHDLAVRRGIPSVCYEDTGVASRLLWFRDFWKGSDELRAALTKHRSSAVALSDLSEPMQAYWREHTGAQWQNVPAQMRAQKKEGEGWSLLKHRVGIALKAIGRGTIFKLGASYISRVASENLKKEYARVVKPFDPSKQFMYFPLHYQPERTTSPQGGIFHQQILVAETLASALPEGWQLVIKEHPSQWWLRSKERYSSVRYRGYYERLARIPGVRIVPIGTSSFELTEKSRAVAAITGTAGWESLLKGKCPLVFGYPWYRDCPGVFRVDSAASCMEALREISLGAKVTEPELLAYLKALEDASIHAYLSEPLEENRGFSSQENTKRIALNIVEFLSKAGS